MHLSGCAQDQFSLTKLNLYTLEVKCTRSLLVFLLSVKSKREFFLLLGLQPSGVIPDLLPDDRRTSTKS